MYPGGPLRESVATNSISQRGVHISEKKQMVSKPQNAEAETHVLKRSTDLLTSALSLLCAE